MSDATTDAATESLDELLSNHLRSVLATCVSDLDFEAPLNVVTVSANGSLFGLRTDGFNSVAIADHCEAGMFMLPINILVTDACGEAARCVIKADGRSQLN